MGRSIHQKNLKRNPTTTGPIQTSEMDNSEKNLDSSHSEFWCKIFGDVSLYVCSLYF